jgi:hypothetical protein
MENKPRECDARLFSGHNPVPVKQKGHKMQINPLVITAIKRAASRVAERLTPEQQAELCAIEGKIHRAKQDLRNMEFESMAKIETIMADN